jgi:RsiW-degrading membrane proteinase PrsW (M82 family)
LEHHYIAHYAPISSAILVAVVIPLVFLYLINWLNFFETHRHRWILLALVWGGIAMGLSYLVDHPLRYIVGLPFVATHTAPGVEEVFKSLVLLYLVRRAATTSFVDGAVYGFAAGIGFAIVENMLYIIRVDVDTGVVLGTLRAFLSAVLHGSASAMVGLAVAGFPIGRVKHPLIAWLIGLIAAISLHTAYNTTAFHTFVFGQTGYLVLAIIAFGGLVLVSAAILWGLRLERRRLRKSLGLKGGLSKGEAMLVGNMEDFDDLLAPIEERFGEVKREQVANALFLGAELTMKQTLIRKTKDPELRAELAPQITELKRELKQARNDVGIYIMSYVRSIMPKTTWSLWARLGKTLEKLERGKTDLWQVLGARLVGHNTSGEAMHIRIRAALDARAQAATLAIEREEE